MPIPISISVYEHAARLIGRTPWEVSRSLDLLVEAHAAAYRLYQHNPVVVGIDIYNLEAEAYGAVVEQPQGMGVPAIVQPLCSRLADIMELPVFDTGRDGRIPMVLAAAQRLRRMFPEAVVSVPVAGPFSIAMNIVGLTALLMDVVQDPQCVRAALLHLAENQTQLARAIRMTGVEAAFFESAAAPPLLSPRQFHDLEQPALTLAMERIGAIMGHAVPCIIGGDTADIAGYIAETGTRRVICPAETDRTRFLAAMALYPEITVRVNLAPALYIHGSERTIARDIDAVKALVPASPNPLLLGTGALPYETDPERVRFMIREAAR